MPNLRCSSDRRRVALRKPINPSGGSISNFGTLAVKDSTVLGNSAPFGADPYDFGFATLDDSVVGVIYS
jgi:hypothetical protein